jgi:hypothetical protein
MKTKVLLLALVTFFALCGNGFAVSEDEAQLGNLYKRLALLENAYTEIIKEHADLSKAAQQIFAEANEILKKVKDFDKAPLASKYKVLVAVYYELTLENLQLKAMVLEREAFVIKMEIERIENKMKQKGV